MLWSSRKIRRVANSALAAESIAAVDVFDDAAYAQRLLKELRQFSMPSHLCVDSKSLFDLVGSTHAVETAEKRPKVDLAILGKAFDFSELDTITWIPRKYQVADALTKSNMQAAEVSQFHSYTERKN